MLTKELLKSNATLAALTDEQIAAIEQLSKNDEDQVIGQKVKEIHDQYDNDIKTITGEDKPGGVKSYDHLKTVLTSMKKKADSAGDTKALQTQIDTLKTEKADLEKKIKDGNTDEVLKGQLQSVQQKLKDKESELKTYKDQVETEKKTLTDQLNAAKQKNTSTAIMNDINQYVINNKLKYKSTIPETILKETITNRQSSMINGLKTDWIDDGNGGQRLIFRDDKGEIMRNKENKLEPYTAGELFFSKNADLFDAGKKQGGAGSGAGGGAGAGGSTPTNLDITAAKTQVQADNLIRKHIVENEKVAKTDPKFAERHQELRTELNVADLPIKEAAAE